MSEVIIRSSADEEIEGYLNLQPKHTRGPWAFSTRTPLDCNIAEWTRVYTTSVTYGEAFPIRGTRKPSPSEEFRRQQYLHLFDVFRVNDEAAQMANARLASAAPDLLEACIHAAIFLRRLSELAVGEPPEAVTMLRTAIVKAVGEEALSR
jgi:hypothetical protein